MPSFEAAVTVARPLEEVFDFFRHPENLVLVSPPDLNLRLVQGPKLLEQGSRIVLQVRRFGVPQRLASEVTVYELNSRLVDELTEGPFRKWVQTHRFEAVPGGTRVSFRIDYEPPGGMLGLVLTASAIARDLQDVFAYRAEKLHELMGSVKAVP